MNTKTTREEKEEEEDDGEDTDEEEEEEEEEDGKKTKTKGKMKTKKKKKKKERTTTESAEKRRDREATFITPVMHHCRGATTQCVHVWIPPEFKASAFRDKRVCIPIDTKKTFSAHDFELRTGYTTVIKNRTPRDHDRNIGRRQMVMIEQTESDVKKDKRICVDSLLNMLLNMSDLFVRHNTRDEDWRGGLPALAKWAVAMNIYKKKHQIALLNREDLSRQGSFLNEELQRAVDDLKSGKKRAPSSSSSSSSSLSTSLLRDIKKKKEGEEEEKEVRGVRNDYDEDDDDRSGNGRLALRDDTRMNSGGAHESKHKERNPIVVLTEDQIKKDEEDAEQERREREKKKEKEKDVNARVSKKKKNTDLLRGILQACSHDSSADTKQSLVLKKKEKEDKKNDDDPIEVLRNAVRSSLKKEKNNNSSSSSSKRMPPHTSGTDRDAKVNRQVVEDYRREAVTISNKLEKREKSLHTEKVVEEEKKKKTEKNREFPERRKTKQDGESRGEDDDEEEEVKKKKIRDEEEEEEEEEEEKKKQEEKKQKWGTSQSVQKNIRLWTGH